MSTPATPDKHPRERSPLAGGWPTGGTQVAGWHVCTACGDSIYPGEHIYDNGDNTVRCAVCEIKRRITATPSARVRGVHVTRPGVERAGDPERPVRLDLFGTAYVDLTPQEAEKVAANLMRAARATRPDAEVKP